MYFGLCQLQLAPGNFHSLIVSSSSICFERFDTLIALKACSSVFFWPFQGCNQFYPLCCLRYELILSEYWHKGHIQKAHNVRFQGEIYSMLDRTRGESSGLPNIHARRNNRFNGMSLKCSVEAKTRSFKSSFFFRTHILWNDLHAELKQQNDSASFQTSLKYLLWDVLLDPN